MLVSSVELGDAKRVFGVEHFRRNCSFDRSLIWNCQTAEIDSALDIGTKDTRACVAMGGLGAAMKAAGRTIGPASDCRLS